MMSNKRTTAARKRTVKDRRRGNAQAAREGWSDEVFGISMGRGRGDRLKVSWLVDYDRFLALMGLDRLRSVLDALEVEFVRDLRFTHALSWADIAVAYDVTGEALRKRLGAAVERSQEQLEHELHGGGVA